MTLLNRAKRQHRRMPWVRYWVERGGSYEGDADGFTVEPGTIHPFLPRRNPHLVRLDTLDDVRCVLALGDPGLGKSWEIDAYVARLAALPEAAADADALPSSTVLGFDLTEFDSRDRFRTDVFEAPAVLAWKAHATGVLYLVLDSLDETSMRLADLCDYLLDQLSGLPLDRLRLRIACRTAAFPQAFQIGLHTLFTAAAPDEAPPTPETDADAIDATAATRRPSDTTVSESRGPLPTRRRRAILTAELVPLTRQDARATAEHRLGNAAAATAFLAAVDAADVGHFAARPQTLFALIDRFQSGASLQAPQQALFRDLIQHACDPTPVTARGNERRPTRTSRDERVRVAARICAAQVFGNRPTIAFSADDAPDTAFLDLRDLTGHESFGTGTLRVDETVLLEAVDTALFTGRGVSGMAAHQTFAEFLAATWLVERDVPFAQIEPLLIDSLDPQGKVVPQLRQVTAWLSTMRVDVFDAVVRREPEIVLWSDVVQVPVARRPALVDALLEAADRNRLDLPERSVTDRLARLEHPKLAIQLRRVITNRRRSNRARDLAMDVAMACRITSIADAAAAIALDPSEVLGLRVEAARLVAAVGADEDRRQLLALATGSIAEDVDDQLKGCAVRACHMYLTPDALFAALTMPKRANFGGSYMLAFAEIEQYLGPEHLDAACAWLRRGVQLSGVTQRLVYRIIRLGLDRLNDPQVRATVATFYWTHASRHETIFGSREEDTAGSRNALRDDAQTRRALLAAIVEDTPPGNAGLYWLGRDVPESVLSADVPWMVEQLTALPPAAAARRGWRDLLLDRMDFSSREHLAAVLAHRSDPDVLALTGRLITDCFTVDEAVEAVHRARDEQAQRAATAQRRSHQAVRDFPVHGRLQSLESRLTATIGAEIPAGIRWSKAMVELCRAADDSAACGHPTVEQVQGLTDPILIAALVEAAERYLADAEVPEDPYRGGRVMWSAIFGFFAGVLLHEHAPERLWDIDEAVWVKWVRSFVGYSGVSAEEDIQGALLQMSLVMAPVATSAELQNALERYATSGPRWLQQGVFDAAVQVDDIAEAFGDCIAAGAYPSDREFEMLGRLLDARPEIGVRCAGKILRTRTRQDAPEADGRRSETLANLLLHAPHLTWPLLKRLAWSHDDIARRVLLRAAAVREYPKVVIEQLADDQLGELYVLVDRLFPYETDIWHTGVYSPSAGDNIEDWRRALPHALESRKRDSAVHALLRAAEADPSRDYRVRIWLRAAAALRSDRWRGIHPRDLIALTAAPHLRVVESGAQLLDLIIESITRLQQELQGEWRSVVGLWDEKAKGQWVPKQEAHLAHELARHLRRDLGERGIVIGRELVLQVGMRGGAGGLRTDIDVTATALEDTRRAQHQVRVVIEVKGSWHPEVLTALRDQLENQYMIPHGIRCGLYVVGMYTCESWTDSEAKRRSTRLGGLSTLQKTLEEQAAAASNEMREVRGMVLNVSLPAEPRPRKRGGKRRTQA